MCVPDLIMKSFFSLLNNLNFLNKKIRKKEEEKKTKYKN
jgi:hypothetical protein